MKLTSALIIILIIACIYSCTPSAKITKGLMDGTPQQQKQIVAMLDSFNIPAANADYKTYFNFLTDYAVFISTDATERWNKKEYMIGQNPISTKKLPGILRRLRGIFILTKQLASYGLMSC